jgi:hypothetical protein
MFDSLYPVFRKAIGIIIAIGLMAAFINAWIDVGTSRGFKGSRLPRSWRKK